MSRRTPQEPHERVEIQLTTVVDTRDRIEAAAKREGMTPNSLIMAALYVYLHKVESGSIVQRKKSVCWSCGAVQRVEKPQK